MHFSQGSVLILDIPATIHYNAIEHIESAWAGFSRPFFV